MTKKLSLLFALMLSTLMASAYDAQIDGIYYNFNATTNEAIVTYLTKNYSPNKDDYTGDVNIPERVTYNGITYSVTSIGSYAFYSCSGLTSVTIPNSVTSIGERAFSGCSSLKFIEIPNSVTSIGKQAFGGSGLTSVTIPNSMTSIGFQTFESCSKLTEVTIGNSVKSIGESAFRYCTGLTSVTIPNSVTSIGFSAFSGCSSLTEVNIGNSVTHIGEIAFFNCSNLKSVTIPNSVTSIGNQAFDGCSSLTSVTIPNSVTYIGNHAFANCTSLKSISVESGNPKYDSRNDCNAIIMTATNTLILGCESTVIPNSVTSIGENAFYTCSGLTSVTIPSSVTEIGYSAFSGCSKLTSVTIPNSVTSIGAYAFQSCNGLKSVIIGNGVTSIGQSAFSYCSNLNSVTIGNSVTSIGKDAFSYCYYGLKNVYCYAEKVPTTNGDIFLSSYIYSDTLYVPEASINDYKITAPWKGFGTIRTLSGEIPQTPTCATPTISYADGKVTFTCETEGVEYVAKVTCTTSGEGDYEASSIPLTTTYKVTVYATKDGYENSDEATLEINVSGGASGLRGDVNEDGEVNVGDMVVISNIMSGNE